MSEKQRHIQITFGRNVTTETCASKISADDVVLETIAATEEYAKMHVLPDEVATAAADHFEKLARIVSDSIRDFAGSHGLSAEQLAGLNQSFAYGGLLSTVDRMRHRRHPFARIVYLSTMLRIMQYNTLMDMGADNVVDWDSMISIKDNVRDTIHVGLDKPVPMRLLIERMAEVNSPPAKPRPENTTRTDVAEKVTRALEHLVSLLPEEKRGRVQGELDMLKTRYGLNTTGSMPPDVKSKMLKALDALPECSVHGKNCPNRNVVRDTLVDDDARAGVIEIDGDVEDPAVQAQIAKQLSEITGSEVSVESISDALRAGFGVINLKTNKG